MTEIITYNGAQIDRRRANSQNNIYNKVKTDRFTLASGSSNPTALSIYKINSISLTHTFSRSQGGNHPRRYDTKIQMYTRWGTESEYVDILLGDMIFDFYSAGGNHSKTWVRTFSSETDEDGYNCWNVAPIIKLGLYERYFNWWVDGGTNASNSNYQLEYDYNTDTQTLIDNTSELFYIVSSNYPMTLAISLETGSQNIHYYDDGAWQSVTPHYYDGTNWVPVRVSRYNGSSWEGI